MRSILLSFLLVPFLWQTPGLAKSEPARIYRKPLSIVLDRRLNLDVIANFDFSRFETSPNHDLFDIKYSNELSSNMFGRSATIYLGEKRKTSSINSPLIPRFMYINQQKTNINDEAAAKKVLEKKPGFKGHKIEFKTNRHGLKLAMGNFNSTDGREEQNYLMIMGTPTFVFTEAHMIDPESLRIEN